MSSKKYDEWKFDFVVSSRDDKPITDELPGALFQAILDWCRDYGLMAGGGFGPYKERYAKELEGVLNRIGREEYDHTKQGTENFARLQEIAGGKAKP